MAIKNKDIADAIVNFSKELLGYTQEELDNISNDIKEIEKTLTNWKIDVPFCYKNILPDSGDLCWDFYQLEQKFRLLYVENYKVKPLIDCKFIIRVKVYPNLSNFIKEFSESIERVKDEN